MPEEGECCHVKQRQVNTQIQNPQNDENEEIEAIIEQEPENEPPKPGLLWRVGSGLWGATSVRTQDLKNFFFTSVQNLAS